MPLHIRHETRYSYEEPARQSVQTLKLTPRREARQRTLRWHIAAPGRRTEQVDAFGNLMHLVTLDVPHSEIRVIVEGEVEVEPQAGRFDEPGPLSPLVYRSPTALTTADAAIRQLATPVAGDGGDEIARAERLAEAVCAALRYRPGTTTVNDSAATALARGEGVCQDQAHLFIACCRAVGIPARYVSGYLLARHTPEVASHAWVDVWLDGRQSWFGLDVTHQRAVDGDHCRLAVGRDYLDAAPVRGVRRGGGRETLEVSVLVSAAALLHQQ